MEESFKAREVEFENNVQQKKRFLWGLARALRDQHQHMTRAMHDVRAETDRLSVKVHYYLILADPTSSTSLLWFIK